MMVTFTMKVHEYFKAIEENIILQLYSHEWCYVIDPFYKTPERIKMMMWRDTIQSIIDKERYNRYRLWVSMGVLYVRITYH